MAHHSESLNPLKAFRSGVILEAIELNCHRNRFILFFIIYDTR